jgi:hypothetical protein
MPGRWLQPDEGVMAEQPMLISLPRSAKAWTVTSVVGIVGVARVIGVACLDVLLEPFPRGAIKLRHVLVPDSVYMDAAVTGDRLH